MNINYKQPQFELFPGNSEDATKPRYLLANVSLTAENLVVFTILGIMGVVFAYSLGVERGKHVMASQMRDTVVAKSVMAEVPIVATQSVATNVGAAHAPVQAATRTVVPATGVAVKMVPAVIAEQKPLVPASAFKYTIQVASYADKKFAHQAAVDLNKKGFETVVMQKGKYAILCVGKFNQKNEAIIMISRLKSKYKDCLVRSM